MAALHDGIERKRHQLSTTTTQPPPTNLPGVTPTHGERLSFGGVVNFAQSTVNPLARDTSRDPRVLVGWPLPLDFGLNPRQ